MRRQIRVFKLSKGYDELPEQHGAPGRRAVLSAVRTRRSPSVPTIAAPGRGRAIGVRHTAPNLLHAFSLFSRDRTFTAFIIVAAGMSVSGKKEFDVKQILRLRWRWFSHSQSSSGSGVGGGGFIQQEGFEHRVGPAQNRLKSRERSGLRKGNSPVHSLLAPTPGPTPVYGRPGTQSWHQHGLIQPLPASDDAPKGSLPDSTATEESGSVREDAGGQPGDPSEEEARERYGAGTPMGTCSSRASVSCSAAADGVADPGRKAAERQQLSFGVSVCAETQYCIAPLGRAEDPDS
ncbi:hypothetical protein Z043_118642 [Scleropages formosus]|uniref:Uncharacterized protein n=1 Tax=Scleropages formosus TaxID=113540 RepID=A0A0P7UU37_SCLFO|nr:hypothetical protein Z043_118642 [Scleropages formosus]